MPSTMQCDMIKQEEKALESLKGCIHSFQSFGTVDGPGVRTVVFFQGCPLRCSCCHNPDTWEMRSGKEMTALELVNKIERYKGYFGKDGGVTLSGGEPLVQAEFATAVFRLCHERGIHCALDSSGCIINDSVIELLKNTDLILLDHKYTVKDDYKRYTGMEKSRVEQFLRLADKMGVKTVIRRVIIPGINDDKRSFDELRELPNRYKCIVKTELLPFRKLCIEKYHKMGIGFPFADVPECTALPEL